MDRFAKMAQINGPKIAAWLCARGIKENVNHVFSARAWRQWDCEPLPEAQGLSVLLFTSDFTHAAPKEERLFHVSDVRLLEFEERAPRSRKRFVDNPFVEDDGDDDEFEDDAATPS